MLQIKDIPHHEVDFGEIAPISLSIYQFRKQTVIALGAQGLGMNHWCGEEGFP
jgi:hypothetical protein